MKIKLFFFSSLIYILILAALVYNLNLGNYSLGIFGINLNLPISIWVILPVFVLTLLAILHMSFYGFLKHLQYKNLIKDSKNYEILLADLFFKKISKLKFKSSEFQELAKIAHSTITMEKTQNQKIDTIIDNINNIKNKKYIELKKYKLESDNEFFILNEKNHIDEDINYAFSLIKNKEILENSLEKYAYEVLLEKADYEKLRILKIKKDEKAILSILERFENKSLELTLAQIEVLLDMNQLDEKAFLKIAKILCKKLEPQNLIAMFKKLKDRNNEATRAYFYILAEFGMYEELLSNIGNDTQEHKDFKLVLFLREHNKKINLENFIQ